MFGNLNGCDVVFVLSEIDLTMYPDTLHKFIKCIIYLVSWGHAFTLT